MRRLPLYSPDYKLPIQELKAEPFDRDCEKCPETLRAGLRAVCMRPEGEGGGLLFLGDWPTTEDDKSKAPLTGQVRRELENIMDRAKYDGPVAFDVALRCNPPKEWESKEFKKWLENCKPYLATSFRELAPKRVICMGPYAAAALVGRTVDTYSSRRGVAWIGDVPVFWVPTYERSVMNRFFMDRFRADAEWAINTPIDKLPRPPMDGYCNIIEGYDDALAAETELRAAGGFAFDVETAGMMYADGFRVLCTAMAPYHRDMAWVWPEAVLENPLVYEVFARLLTDPAVSKAGQNGKFDIKALRARYKLVIKGYKHDTHLIARARYSDAKATLDTIAELVGMGGHKRELKIVLLKQRERINKTREKVRKGKIGVETIDDPQLRRAVEMDELKADAFAYGLTAKVAPELLWRYNALDAVSTSRGVFKLLPEITLAVHPGYKDKDLAAHYERLITKLTPALVQIEHWGMPVSLERMRAADDLVRTKLEAVTAKIEAMKPGLNPRSNDQLRDYIYKELKLPEQKSFKKRKKDGPTVDAHALKGLRDKHPFIPLLMEYKKLDKLRGTYTLGLQQFVTPDGRIHPWFSPGGTKTGRLSSQEPNCFDGETEVLTPTGWTRFADYIPGTRVMQWNVDNTLEFVKPTGYIHKRQETLHITTRAIDLAVTPDHRCLLFDRTGQMKITNAARYLESHQQRHAGHYQWPGRVNLSPAQIGFICAVQADGKIELHESAIIPAVCFGFRKTRKIDRLRGILQSLAVAYTENVYADGTTYFRINQRDVPGWLWLYISKDKNKHFGAWLLELSREGAETFAAEVFHWDGLFERKTNYSSNERVNCDWVQTVMVLLNKRAKVRAYAAASGNTNWQVDVRHARDASWTNNRKIKSLGEQDVYCVSLPSTYILVRRNGRVCVTGQCQNLGGGKEEADKIMSKMIKDMFVASPGYVLLQLDYSQLELRVAALLCEDPAMRDIFVRGLDYHMAAAKLVAPSAWGIKPEDVTKAHRSMVKTVVFGLLYGMTDHGLATRLGIKVEEAARLRQAIFGGFPFLARWYQRMHRYASEKGLCLTYWKGQPARRRPLLDIGDTTGETRWNGEEVMTPGKRKAKNAAINTPVQGSASDFMLMSLVEIVDAILAGDLPARVIGSVHDSAIIEVREDYAETMALFAQDTMESQGWGDVPIAVDIERGPSWGSLKPWDPRKSRELTHKAKAAVAAGELVDAKKLLVEAIKLSEWNTEAANMMQEMECAHAA